MGFRDESHILYNNGIYLWAYNLYWLIRVGVYQLF